MFSPTRFRFLIFLFIRCARTLALFACILFLACTFHAMDGAGPDNPWLAWVLENFDNPIWHHDLAPERWRRRPAVSAPVSPRSPGGEGDGGTDMFAASVIRRRRYAQSDPVRDRPSWVPSRHASPWVSHTSDSGYGSPMSTDTSLSTAMSRVADSYWRDRGWVLHLFVILEYANTNWSYRGRSGSLRGKSRRQIPQDSPHHSARRSSSSN